MCTCVFVHSSVSLSVCVHAFLCVFFCVCVRAFCVCAHVLRILKRVMVRRPIHCSRRPPSYNIVRRSVSRRYVTRPDRRIVQRRPRLAEAGTARRSSANAGRVPGRPPNRPAFPLRSDRIRSGAALGRSRCGFRTVRLRVPTREENPPPTWKGNPPKSPEGLVENW